MRYPLNEARAWCILQLESFFFFFFFFWRNSKRLRHGVTRLEHGAGYIKYGVHIKHRLVHGAPYKKPLHGARYKEGFA